MVELGAAALAPFTRFSLYNSPYPAHDHGCAIDLYPPAGTTVAPSPVAGTVIETREVAAPTRAYAAATDHLIVVETATHTARMLHVDPTVSVGETIAVGDPVGTLVTSGYAAPWVPDHVHLGFRDPEADPVRARGSVPVSVDVSVTPVPWDGAGTVVDVGDTYATLDAPVPTAGFGGVAANGGVLDGGLPHYAGGGLLDGADGPVTVVGTTVGTATDRDVAWADVTVTVDGAAIRGLALSVGRDDRGVKLVAPDHELAVGDVVEVALSVA
ncbi:MAG: hypothetical protein ABEJ57_08760 [Halobacteriaceae archaeon]